MFNPQDFLNFARNLLDCGDLIKNEALYRSAISRLYYAAFLSAREKIDYLEPGYIAHFNVDSHDEVTRGLLLGRFYAKDMSLSDDLVELKRFRIEADYHFPNACNSNERCRVPRRNPDVLQTAEHRDIIKKQQKKYRQEHREEFKKRDKIYYQEHKQERKIQDREYYQKNKAKIRDSGKKYYQKHREKMKEYLRKYYQGNKEQITETSRKYYHKNKEKIKKKQKEYYYSNKDEISKCRKEYHQKHKEEICKRVQKWRQENKEKHNRINRDRKLKKKQLSENFTFEEWQQKVETTNGACPLCGKSYTEIYPFTVTLDHTPPISKAPIGYCYNIDDISPLCGSCNSSKGASF